MAAEELSSSNPSLHTEVHRRTIYPFVSITKTFTCSHLTVYKINSILNIKNVFVPGYKLVHFEDWWIRANFSVTSIGFFNDLTIERLSLICTIPSDIINENNHFIQNCQIKKIDLPQILLPLLNFPTRTHTYIQIRNPVLLSYVGQPYAYEACPTVLRLRTLSYCPT